MDRKGFYIVSRRDGKPLTESGFNAIWQRHKARLNLGPVQFHGLRKNATAALYEAGCSPQQVQGLTDHKTYKWCSIAVGEHAKNGWRDRPRTSGKRTSIELK